MLHNENRQIYLTAGQYSWKSYYEGDEIIWKIYVSCIKLMHKITRTNFFSFIKRYIWKRVQNGAVIKITAYDDAQDVKTWKIFIEYDRSAVTNLFRFISYLARDTHSHYRDAPHMGQRSRSHVLPRRSIIVRISVGHVSLSVRTWEV